MRLHQLSRVVLILSFGLVLISCSNEDNSSSSTTDTFDAKKYALVDLHLHLNGSLSPEEVIEMGRIAGDTTVPLDPKEVEKMISCPETVESLAQYLQCTKLPSSLNQSREALIYSVSSIIKRLDKAGLIYIEIRFAPSHHLKGTLKTQEEAVLAAIEGLKKGLSEAQNGIKCNLILCCMRNDPDATNRETVEVAKKYLGKGVCAIDLAGDEAAYPTENFRALFAYATELGLPFTIHCGEAAGVESMKAAISFGTKRIGHGVRAAQDAETKTLLKQHDICLTCCPTSNMQTKAVVMQSFKEYPLPYFLNDGVAVAISTDNMTISQTTVEREFQKLHDAGVINAKDAETLVINAIQHAFCSDADKAELLAKAKARMH